MTESQKNMKLFLIVIILIFTTTIHYKSYSQALKIVPPTPNAMKMTEFHAQKPNMYTGTANVSIPLHTIDFDGMELPLSISYNATGIRTNEEASEVGLGWALSATGLISRTIKGGDDLFQGDNLGNHKGYVYNDEVVNYNLGYDWKVNASPPASSYYHRLASQKSDTQSDIFNYNFFGYSGSFVLSQKVSDPNSNPILRKILVLKITQDACSIFFDETSQTFSVMTPNGYRGDFTVFERSTSFSASVNTNNRINCCEQNNIIIEDVIKSERFRTTTSWYLSQIKSPRGQRITFSYDMKKAAPDGNTYSPVYPDSTVYSPYISNSRAFGEAETITSLPSCLQTVQEHVYLKNIISEEIKIDFLMEDREDLRRNYLFASDSNSRKVFHKSLNLRRYKGINVYGLNGSTLNKSIVLKQGYFNQQYQDAISNNQNENEVRWLRSRLDRIMIDDQEYKFYYSTGIKGLPNKTTTGMDHFGFYNGQDQITQLLPPNPINPNCDLNDNSTVYYSQSVDRRVDFAFGIAGLLNKVKYPTRGYTTFEYEPHTYLPEAYGDFREISGTSIAGGARIRSIKEYDYFDANSPIRSTTYCYTESADINPTNTSSTTGRLMTPLYNRYKKILFTVGGSQDQPSSCVYLYRTYSSIPGNNSAEGKVIGYSKVHEVVIGKSDNYRNSYYFENRSNRVSDWNLTTFGYPNLNGQLIDSRNYNDQDKIIQRVLNQDYIHNIGTDSIKTIVYEQGYDNNGSVSSDYIFYTFIGIKRTFNKPYTIVTTSANSPSAIIEDGQGNIVTYGRVIQITKTLAYNNKFLLSSEKIQNSVGEDILTQYKRPSDYSTKSIALARMADSTVNMVEPIIEQFTKKNNQIVGASGNYYFYDAINNRINLTNTYSYNPSLPGSPSSTDGLMFASPYEMKVDYTFYDPASGKLLQYKASDGVTNSFVWGYNNKLPIVHGVDIPYSQLKTAYDAAISGTTLGSSSYESTIRSHANTVGKQISTYLHNPLVGILKVTSPAGFKRSFQYDAYSRLNKVLDNDDKTVEQYQYHFKELPLSRILTVSSTNIDFGTLTPDMFAAQFNPYVRCSDDLRSKVLTLTNTGEDDLTITGFTLPNGFFSYWSGGVVASSTSVNVIISFIGTTTNTNYSGNISIGSNQTAGPTLIQIPITANYADRNCNAIVTPAILDFGVTSSSFLQQNITIKNSGNAPIKLIGVPLNWTVGNTNYSTFTHPDFTVGLNSNCLAPGQSETITVNFVPKGNGQTSTKLSLAFDECPTLKDVVTIQGDRRPINFTEVIAIVPSSLILSPFSIPTSSQNITVSNSGNWPLTVQSATSTNSNFTLSPTNFVVPANNGSQVVAVTFTPPAFDFSNQNTTFTFNGDQTSGVSTIAVSGQRTALRTIQLSSNTLIFDYTGQTQNVTVSNAGNDYLNITGVSYPGTANWSASITPSLLAPGQTTNLSITRTSGASEPLNFTVNSTKNGGNEVVQVSVNTRTIGLSTAIIAFPAFSVASISQNVVVSNTGNTTLNISSMSSTNAMFTVSPSTIVIPAGGQQNATVTFTPTAYNFSLQSATLTFNGDQTGGTNTISVSGQRTQLKTIQLSTNSLSFNYTGQTQYISVTNGGNDNISINGVSYPSTSNWYATISPTILSPGQSSNLAITKTTGTNETLNISVLSDKNSGNEVVQVSYIPPPTRVISLSTITFSSFSGTSATQALTVTNNGNSTLNIQGISSSNPKFTFSSSSFPIAPGNSQNVTVTYTPTDFTSQSTTITVSSDATSGNGTTTTSAQRSQLAQLSVSPTSLSIKPSIPVQTCYITNIGNVSSTVNSVSNSNSGSFSLTYYSGGFPASLPITLPPGSQLQIEVRTLNSDYSSANGTLSIDNSITSPYVVSLSRSTF